MSTEAKNGDNLPRDIYPSLADFGEVPSNYISLFVEIPWEHMSHIAKFGLRTEDNQMAARQPALEALFKKVSQRYGIKIDRTQCVFAYPRNPVELDHHPGLKPEQDALVEMKINPEVAALVVDGNFYSEAGIWMRETSDDEAEYIVERYWEKALSLPEYLRLSSKEAVGNDNDFDDFRNPEVLIPTDVPVEHLRIVG